MLDSEGVGSSPGTVYMYMITCHMCTQNTLLHMVSQVHKCMITGEMLRKPGKNGGGSGCGEGGGELGLCDRLASYSVEVVALAVTPFMLLHNLEFSKHWQPNAPKKAQSLPYNKIF